MQMIEPGELYRYFKVREIRNGREVWLLGADTRYEVTDPDGICWNYRIAPDGDHFLARSAVHTHPWGRPMRLEEVEPLPDGRGLYHPDWDDARALGLAASYEGSWRQYADRLGARPHGVVKDQVPEDGGQAAVPAPPIIAQSAV